MQKRVAPTIAAVVAQASLAPQPTLRPPPTVAPTAKPAPASTLQPAIAAAAAPTTSPTARSTAAPSERATSEALARAEARRIADTKAAADAEAADEAKAAADAAGANAADPSARTPIAPATPAILANRPLAAPTPGARSDGGSLDNPNSRLNASPPPGVPATYGTKRYTNDIKVAIEAAQAKYYAAAAPPPDGLAKVIKVVKQSGGLPDDGSPAVAYILKRRRILGIEICTGWKAIRSDRAAVKNVRRRAACLRPRCARVADRSQVLIASRNLAA